MHRVPTLPGKSWIFFGKICRTWKVLENDFGPGRSWKFKLKAPESSEICWTRAHTPSFFLTVIKHSSSLHVTVMNIAVLMLLSHSYM